MNHYQAGARVEREVAEDLGRHGYDVIRSAASKGAADLVAVHDGEILFVQVKKNDATRTTPAERGQLIRVSDRIKGTPLVAYKIPDPTDGRRSKIVYRELTAVGPKAWLWWIPRGVTMSDEHGKSSGGTTQGPDDPMHWPQEDHSRPHPSTGGDEDDD